MAGSALIGSLAVSLGLETAAFQKGASLAEKEANALKNKFEGIGKSFAKVGGALTVGITAPLGAFAKGAFDAATNAGELQSAFDQTFGTMSKSMNAWAVATGDAMGRSTREIQEGAKSFGLYFNQAAKTREEAAKMSQTFTILAQDLSSFHNTSVDEALLALRSGLSGESEPLRRYGVFLNEAAVAAKAAEMGFKGVGGALTDQEKIMARAAIIMEKTKNAQGDVARTSGSTANQLRASAAAWEELQITVGTKLLPVLTPLITKFAQLLNSFTQLSPATQGFIVAGGAIAAVLGPVIMGIGGIVSGVGAVIPLFVKFTPLILAATKALALMALTPVGAVITAIAVAVGAVYLAWKNWDQISAILKRLYEGVKTWLVQKMGEAFDFVTAKVKAVGDAFYKLWDRVVGHSYVPDMVEGVGEWFDKLDPMMVQPAVAMTDKVAEAFAGMGEGINRSLASNLANFRGFKSLLKGVLGEIAFALEEVLFQKLGGSSGGLGGALQSIFGSIFGVKGPAGPASTGVTLPPSFDTGLGGFKFGGFRAAGGPVVPGKSYVVGERGPEWFTPSRGGNIAANDGGAGGTVIQNINFSGAVDLATKAEVYRVASLIKPAAIEAVQNRQRRRG